MTEAAFASAIEATLSLTGWLWVHQRPARTRHGWVTAMSGSPGFPDYLALRDARCLAIELKSDVGRVRAEQAHWLDAFAAVPGIEAYVWRPSDDWHVITEILRRDTSAAA